MQRLLEGEVLSETRFACETSGGDLSKTAGVKHGIGRAFLRERIWRQKLLVKIKCTA